VEATTAFNKNNLFAIYFQSKNRAHEAGGFLSAQSQSYPKYLEAVAFEAKTLLQPLRFSHWKVQTAEYQRTTGGCVLMHEKYQALRNEA